MSSMLNYWFGASGAEENDKKPPKQPTQDENTEKSSVKESTDAPKDDADNAESKASVCPGVDNQDVISEWKAQADKKVSVETRAQRKQDVQAVYTKKMSVRALMEREMADGGGLGDGAGKAKSVLPEKHTPIAGVPVRDLPWSAAERDAESATEKSLVETLGVKSNNFGCESKD